MSNVTGKTARNAVTGDEIKSKINTPEFESNFDRIFRKGNLEQPQATADKPLECPNYPDACFCTGACQKQRLKAIAQNGNVGYDLDSIYQQVEKDYQE
jgi:hypothetical protein